MKTAHAALLVSSISASFALMSLATTWRLFTLAGAQLEVRLIPAVLTSTGHLLQRDGDDGSWCKGDPTPEEMTDDLADGYVDLAIIRVTNTGRTAMWVSKIQLDVGRSKKTRWGGRRSRHAIGGRAVVVHECNAPDGDVRLEPGQSFSIAMDHEPLIQYALNRKNARTTPAWLRRFAKHWPSSVRRIGIEVRAGYRRATRRSVVVRGSAFGASRRPTRSSWRRRWKAKPGSRRIYYPWPSSLQHDFFRAVFRAVYLHGNQGDKDDTRLPVEVLVYKAWVALGVLWMQDTVGVDAVKDALREVLGVGPPVPGEGIGMEFEIVKAALALALTPMPDEMTINGHTVKRGWMRAPPEGAEPS